MTGHLIIKVVLASITATTQQLDRIEIILTKSTLSGIRVEASSSAESRGRLWGPTEIMVCENKGKESSHSTGESFPGLNLEVIYFTFAYIPEVRFQGHT